MSVLIAAGRYANLLERIAAFDATKIAVATEDSLYPKANLYDGRPGRPYKATAASASITIDGNLIINGGMETASGGNVASWTENNSGTGDVTRTTAAGEFNSGAAGMKLNAGNSAASAFQDVVVRSGQRLTLSFAIKGPGASSIWMRVSNLATARYLKSDLTWANGDQRVASRGAATWATQAVTFTVEALSVCLTNEVTLRIEIFNETPASIGFADDVYLWPSVNFFSIHGHNCVAQAVELKSSTDNFATSTQESAPAPMRPTFFGYKTTPVDRRYWQVNVNYCTEVVTIGELFVGYVTALDDPGREPAVSPWQVDVMFDGSSTETPQGEVWAFAQGRDLRRRVRLPFFSTTAARHQQILDEVLFRSRLGIDPVIFVPVSSETMVLHGRVDRSWSARRVFGTPARHESDLIVTESPFWFSTT